MTHCVVRIDKGHHGEEVEGKAPTHRDGCKRKVGRQHLTDLHQNAASALQKLRLEDLPIAQAQRREVVRRVHGAQQQLSAFRADRQHTAVHEADVLCAQHREVQLPVHHALLVSASDREAKALLKDRAGAALLDLGRLHLLESPPPMLLGLGLLLPLSRLWRGACLRSWLLFQLLLLQRHLELIDRFLVFVGTFEIDGRHVAEAVLLVVVAMFAVMVLRLQVLEQ
mmetsp:Transcript_30305/g.72308  ORF Transcript_30305/g.72308 Transcript_30305/m.72308 type:complete len:225 (+) Transcript_30305:406-1080(+)